MKIKYQILILLLILFAGCSKTNNADIYGEGIDNLDKINAPGNNPVRPFRTYRERISS